MKLEYRVIWQREGLPKRREFYQTWEGAKNCAERQETAEEEMDWLNPPLLPIVYGPIIESREVKEWESMVMYSRCDNRISVKG